MNHTQFRHRSIPSRSRRTSKGLHAFLLATVMVAGLGVADGATAGDGDAGPEAEQVRQILEATGVKGGFFAHLGCADGKLTAALARRDGCLVHGLDTEAKHVTDSRIHVRSVGLCSKVSIDTFDGRHLPYIDNGVNLVLAERLGDVAMDEVMRVLCPGGVAFISAGAGQGAEVRGERVKVGAKSWLKAVKPRPAEIDEWTHYLHGPDNNAVAQDAVVSSPFHVQWVGGPKWARHHNHLSSTSAMVSAGGRLFAIVDEGPPASLALPAKWMLVARDAFSGVVLWKKPVGPWEGVLRPFRSGPTELARRLVAIDEHVYVTLGYGQPITALDAGTGDVVRTYTGTEQTVEIIHDDGAIYAVAGTIDPQKYAEALRRGKASPAPRDKRVLAVRTDTGRIIWQKSDADSSGLLPTTLCFGGGQVFFQSTSHVVCLDAASGKVNWRTPRPVRRERLAWSAPTLVVHEDVILSADCASGEPTNGAEGAGIKWTVTAGIKRGDVSLGDLIAFSTKGGEELWRCPTAQGFNAPADVFVADGLVWTSSVPNLTSTDFTEGRDPRTGEVKRQLETDAAFTVTHHHRCYRNKATDRFIFLGRTGVELIDLSGSETERHCWVRGACQYGVLPANGLLYAPPHSCACYIQSKLSGFWALAPRRESGNLIPGAGAEKRLQRGPGFGAVASSQLATGQGDDWPTYRHDKARTGATTTRVASDLKPAWKTTLGGRLTGVVVAEGKVLVAAVDARSIHALDANSGKQLWRYAVGGRVDSPPTVHDGLAVVGCADGFVYCLRLADGELVWRFRAAPADRRIVAFGQIESLWPVTGSVLVHDGVVHCTAGRSSFLDGGMSLCRLDLATGELLSEKRFYSRDLETGEQPEEIIDDVELPGTLPDVLVYDGQHVYLRDNVMDLNGVQQQAYVPHLYSSAGLLDDAWWHRTYWLWGERTWGRASGWHVMPGFRPSGRILVTDESTVFGYGRKRVRGNDLQGYHLFRADKEVKPINKKIKNNNVAVTRLQKPAKVTEHWSRDVPLVARAMVLADKMLFVAGPAMAIGDAGVTEPPFDAGGPALMMAFGAETGQDLSRHELDAQPVFDGMVAAYGSLFLSTVDGKVVCLKGK